MVPLLTCEGCVPRGVEEEGEPGVDGEGEEEQGEQLHLGEGGRRRRKKRSRRSRRSRSSRRMEDVEGLWVTLRCVQEESQGGRVMYLVPLGRRTGVPLPRCTNFLLC